MKIKKFSITAYCILLHLFIGIIIVKTNFIDKVRWHLGFQQNEISDYYLQLVEFQKRIDQVLPDKRLIFIGDSLIQGLYVQAVAENAVNYGIGNDTTEGVLRRIPQYASLSKASAVVISIGINDLEFRSSQQFADNYQRILNKIPTQTNIIANEILPINESAELSDKISNSDIRQSNIYQTKV